MSDNDLDYELTKIKQSNPKLTEEGGKSNKTKKNKNNLPKGNKDMKKLNWKNIWETLKTITIVTLIAGVIGFGLGVKHQESKNDQLNNKVIQQLHQLKSEK